MKPLLPAPWVTAIAILCTAGLLVNIFLDGAVENWDGTQGTYVLGGLVAGVLGLPFGFAMFRRTDNERRDDEKDRQP